VGFGTWIGFIALILALYVLWQIKQVVMLLFTAVILATALNMFVNQLQKWSIKLSHLIAKKFNLPKFKKPLYYFIFKNYLYHPKPILSNILIGSRFELGFKNWKLKRGYSVLLTIILFIGIFIGFVVIIVPAFITQFEELVKLVPKGIDQLNTSIDMWIDKIEGYFSIEIGDFIPDINEIIAQLQPVINELFSQGWIFFSNSLVVILNILLIVVLTLMILVDPQPYRKGFIRLFPAFYRRRIDQILSLCEESLRGWLVGILFNMLAISVFSFIGLIILQIPLALSQAMLAGLFTFIPNIGPALSVIPPMAIALIDAPWKSLAVLILYIVIQQLESSILTPMIMARQVSLLPALTLLAQVFFASFFGFLGLFLALPLTVISQVFFKEIIIKDILDKWEKPVDHEN
jgi:predicted PurR-regulated permease PerM